MIGFSTSQFIFIDNGFIPFSLSLLPVPGGKISSLGETWLGGVEMASTEKWREKALNYFSNVKNSGCVTAKTAQGSCIGTVIFPVEELIRFWYEYKRVDTDLLTLFPIFSDKILACSIPI